jgi:RNA polymerase sigma-54 factor
MSGQRIKLRHNQRLQLNTSLAAGLQILQMDAGGLTRFLEEQAERNPFIALDPPPVQPGGWLPNWKAAFRATFQNEAAEPTAAAPSLMAHVLQQISTVTRSARERRIALMMAEALEPSGWLGRPLAEISAAAGCALGDAEAVLSRLQSMEPTGLFARSLAECLRLQAVEAGKLDATMSCCLEHLDLLAAGGIARLAAMCKVDEGDILARLRIIRSFDPKPGARFDPGAIDVREPDLVVSQTEAGWEITLNRSALPGLRVLRPGGRPTADEERAALAEALGLRRLIERRNTTLLRVAREILARQSAMLEQGPAALVPLTMATVAEALDLHESTVSRVVSGVSVASPKGTWPLRSLFSARIGDRSAAAIRATIMAKIAEESPAAPLDDAAIAIALEAEGLPVARRTVAKYREMLRIPTASVRRRQRRL